MKYTVVNLLLIHLHYPANPCQVYGRMRRRAHVSRDANHIFKKKKKRHIFPIDCIVESALDQEYEIALFVFSHRCKTSHFEF